MLNNLFNRPKTLLQLEGLFVFIASLVLYNNFGGSWWLFVGFLLIPDLTMVGYVINEKIGASIYNIGHHYALPIILGIVGLTLSNPLFISLSLIYFTHIGMDRGLGYGLKLPTGFKHTHLNHA